MVKRTENGNDRARQLLAQEAARIIVEQGIGDYRSAKIKAAERLGMSAYGALPGNPEIEAAVSEHLKLFGRESHSHLLRVLREAAVSAMELLALFEPRLVGPVLNGTAAVNSAINLHVFADSPEMVAMHLQDNDVSYRPCERRMKSRRDFSETFAGFRFTREESCVEATVFPVNGMRQAPISPVDGKPMRRAEVKTIIEILNGE